MKLFATHVIRTHSTYPLLIACATIVAFNSLPASAARNRMSSGDSPPSGFFLGVGALGHNAGKIATDAETGDQPLFATLYPQITAMALFPLFGNLHISPELRYAALGKGSPDEGQTTRTFSAGVRGLMPLFSILDWHLGSGFLFYQISGDEGTISLNNGNATTTFGQPGTSATSTLMYWDAGLGATFGDLRIETSVLVTGLLGSKRAFNPAATVSWRLF